MMALRINLCSTSVSCVMKNKRNQPFSPEKNFFSDQKTFFEKWWKLILYIRIGFLRSNLFWLRGQIIIFRNLIWNLKVLSPKWESNLISKKGSAVFAKTKDDSSKIGFFNLKIWIHLPKILQIVLLWHYAPDIFKIGR